MTFRPENEGGDSHKERLIRVEERLKHMDETQGIALRDLKSAIHELVGSSKLDSVETRARLATLELRLELTATKEEVQIERDRTNKIYWIFGAVWALSLVVSKYLLTKFGL